MLGDLRKKFAGLKSEEKSTCLGAHECQFNPYCVTLQKDAEFHLRRVKTLSGDNSSEAARVVNASVFFIQQ